MTWGSRNVRTSSCILMVCFLLVLLTSRVHGQPHDIGSDLAEIRTTYDGLSLHGFSVNGAGDYCALGSDGLLKANDGDALSSLPSDAKSVRWHVGSCTKSITATLFAILLENEAFGPNIDWTTPLVQVLPEADNTAYETVQLEQLLGMQSCIPPNPPNWFVYSNWGWNPPALSEQRRAATMDALVTTPTHPIGTAHCYSNWAYVVAGHIMEVATGRLWEELVATEIFEPLGIFISIETAFGPPIGDKHPWGHHGASGALRPCDPSSPNTVCDNPAVMGPAGTFSGATEAMAAYLAWHVACHNGEDSASILSPSECRKLHTPVNQDVSTYALGWLCSDRSWAGGNLACSHLGSNTLWMYNMWIAPGIDRAFVSATNTARDYYETGAKDFWMTDKTIGLLIERRASCPAPIAPTTQPVVPTDSSVIPSESPVAATDSPVAPTGSPVAATPSPVAPTGSPVAATDSPVAPTGSPVATTPSPVAPTGSPVASTGSPVAATYAPAAPTDSPVATTDEPADVTVSPVALTNSPVAATNSPVAPVVSDTLAPVNATTAAPVSVETTAPVAPTTVGPVVGTPDSGAAPRTSLLLQIATTAVAILALLC